MGFQIEEIILVEMIIDKMIDILEIVDPQEVPRDNKEAEVEIIIDRVTMIEDHKMKVVIIEGVTDKCKETIEVEMITEGATTGVPMIREELTIGTETRHHIRNAVDPGTDLPTIGTTGGEMTGEVTIEVETIREEAETITLVAEAITEEDIVVTIEAALEVVIAEALEAVAVETVVVLEAVVVALEEVEVAETLKMKYQKRATLTNLR